MNIKTIAAIDPGSIKTKELKLNLFKPYNLNCRLYLNETAFIEFEYLENDKQMTLDDFYHECGYVLNAEIINDKEVLDKLKEAYDYLLSTPMTHAEKIDYADNSPAAILTRAILKDYPRANKYEFQSLAIDKAFELGYRKDVINEAIRLYA